MAMKPIIPVTSKRIHDAFGDLFANAPPTIAATAINTAAKPKPITLLPS